ncbi:MAG: hypothetical protein ACKPE3_19020 [Sphaerospermopsis kisseleviana]
MLIENLNQFLTDFATTLTVGAAEYQCIFNIENSPMGIGSEGRQITATLKTSDITTANIRHNTTVTIEGKTYTAIGVQPIDDGKFSDLLLRE